MATYRVGWHVNGQGGHRGALGEYLAQLSAAGLQPVINAVDDAGMAVEAVSHGAITVYRKTEWSAAPDYNVSADEAAQVRWQGIKALIPPEIEAVKDAVVIEVTNEPDRARADWLGRFMLRISQLGNADGYVIGGPSFAAGNPEISDWETPGMLAYLDYVAMHADTNAICLHEYSLDSADIKTISPWLVGRYQFMFDVCEDNGILKPPVIITELGWSYRSMPDSGVMEQIAWAAELYGDIPVCWWTLGSGTQWGDLPQKLSAYVAPVTEWMLANSEPPDEPEPPPPDPVDWRRAVWEASVTEQQARGITLNPTHGLEKLIYAREGYQVVHREITHRLADGTAYGLMAAEHLGGEEPRIVLAFKRPWSGAANVEVLTEADVPEPEPEPFAWRAWPTDYRVITQTAGNNPAYYGKIAPDFEGHEGLDIRAPMGAPVYSVDDGIVSDMRQLADAGHPYGRFVRVRHEGGYESTYAHLNSIAVGVGEPVEAGQVIAHADNTGNIVSGSSHLHVTLKKDGAIVDPTPFILPWKPNFPGLPPAAHGITICDVSGHQGAIDFHKMMRRGAHACYIRGSIGGTGQDTRFVTNWNTIAQTPMKRGMYHLFRSDSSARRNLDNILRVVDLHGAGDMRIALDIEPVTNLPRIDGNKVTELIGMFKAELGYSPLVYTGLWVLDRTDGDRSWFLHPYLWLASYWQSPPQMNQFPQLPIGSELSKLVAHQFTSSYYDGRAWGTQSIGLDVNIVYDLDRLLVTGDAPEPPPPAPVPTIDTLPYLRGDGRLYEVRNASGGQERFQTQRDGNIFYQTKNAAWEMLIFDDNHIYRDVDTSPGGGRYYRLLESGVPGSRWIPRQWRPGEKFTQARRVQFYDKATCARVDENSGNVTDTMQFVARHATYKFRTGIELPDVVELLWTNGGERYFYARNFGLVGWERQHQDPNTPAWSAISEIHEPGSRPDNVRETGCYS